MGHQEVLGIDIVQPWGLWTLWVGSRDVVLHGGEH